MKPINPPLKTYAFLVFHQNFKLSIVIVKQLLVLDIWIGLLFNISKWVGAYLKVKTFKTNKTFRTKK